MHTLNPLIITPTSLRAIQYWPIELRALFDPQADRELAERVAAEREQAQAECERRADDELPF